VACAALAGPPVDEKEQAVDSFRFTISILLPTPLYFIPSAIAEGTRHQNIN
jgi:hypothetical protein